MLTLYHLVTYFNNDQFMYWLNNNTLIHARENYVILLFGVLQWTDSRPSIIIIYNSTWSILIQWIRDILSGDNLTYYIQKSVLPVCDKPYHMNNGFQQMWAEIEIEKLRNYALSQLIVYFKCKVRNCG